MPFRPALHPHWPPAPNCLPHWGHFADARGAGAAAVFGCACARGIAGAAAGCVLTGAGGGRGLLDGGGGGAAGVCPNVTVDFPQCGQIVIPPTA